MTIPSLTLRSEKKKNNNGTERLRALKYFLNLLSSILVNPQQCLASFIPKKNKRYNSHDFPESNYTCCSPRVCWIRVNELLNLIQVSTVAWAHFRIFPFFCLAIFASTTGHVQESRDQELIVFELIAESKMSVEWESPDFHLNAPQNAM